jgi:hypothetical protein
MNTTYEVPLSPTFRKHYDAGVDKGEDKGERNAVRLVLKARNLKPTAEQTAMIDDCKDLGTLKLWAERGTTATSTDDIFQ